MVSQATRLWFYFMIYFRKNEYKSRYSVKEESSKYKGQQQRH